MNKWEEKNEKRLTVTNDQIHIHQGPHLWTTGEAKTVTHLQLHGLCRLLWCGKLVVYVVRVFKEGLLHLRREAWNGGENYIIPVSKKEEITKAGGGSAPSPAFSRLVGFLGIAKSNLFLGGRRISRAVSSPIIFNRSRQTKHAENVESLDSFLCLKKDRIL